MPTHEITIYEIPRDHGSPTLRWACRCGKGTPQRKGALGTVLGSVAEALQHVPDSQPFVISGPESTPGGEDRG